jgi:hypothetical protein
MFYQRYLLPFFLKEMNTTLTQWNYNFITTITSSYLVITWFAILYCTPFVYQIEAINHRLKKKQFQT